MTARLRVARRTRVLVVVLALLAAVAVVVVGIVLDRRPGPGPTPVTPTPTAGATTPEESPEPTATTPPGPVDVTVTDRTEVVDDLAAPWGMALLPGGDLLVTLRDTGTLVRVAPDGTTTPVTGPGADALARETVHRGESGLLGVAVAPGTSDIVVQRTGTDGNAVLRGTLTGATLGELTTLLDGIASAQFHDGGAVAFGPDGMLYVATGDATEPRTAQDPDSLNGKILRLTPEGEPAPGNPVPGSPVWSLGHRNVQGLGWDADGRMFASELGQDTFDELNQILPGRNYGWPEVEGTGGTDDGFEDPLVTWTTDEASPSGLAVTDEGVYVAALRGERLWRVDLAELAEGAATPTVVLDGLGRLRGVLAEPGGTLLVSSSATDGRGEPRAGDDRVWRLTLGRS
ncbi:sorbosone dehydrogenase family protein [Sanguibacter sp. HDW7]|uniref:PQQ-dependent sugar dehydrogenase n=1 Tax=Sanguibacter sp. HDW7 TaxID=2714931 RepID=UPI001F0E497B|nr:PQQ-dependent sugar dehydrogenase [Sanguibacter sp. HDW7]